MRRNALSFRPEANQLETKVLLSLMATPNSGTGDTADVTILAASSTGASIQPANTISGNYFAAEDGRAADAPLDVKVDGTGKLGGFGPASMSGSIQFGGFLPAGVADIKGTVTLTNAKGSITIRLTGHGGNGQVPGKSFALTASVVKGTGAFKNFRRIGAATAKFGPSTIQSIAAPTPIGGTLTLKFALRPPIR